MSKRAKIFMYICFGGIGVYLIRCINSAIRDRFRAPLWDYLGLGYMTVWGAIALLSCFGLVGLGVSRRIGKRREAGKEPFSKGYRISFYISFVPYALLLLYCAYCSKYGFSFLWSTSYGWEAFEGAFTIMGLVFCVIPVFPFCIFWQILYIVKWVRNRKANA